MSDHTLSKKRDRDRPLPHAVHTIGVEIGLGGIAYGLKKAVEYIASRPYKLFPGTQLIRPQALKWGATRWLGRIGKGLEAKLFGKIPIVGPAIDLLTPSETIMTGSQERRLVQQTRARWENIERQVKQGVISKEAGERAKFPWAFKQKDFSTGNKLRPRPPLPNIASQIHVNLPQTRKSIKRQSPPLKRIKDLPKFKGGLVTGPNLGDIFKSNYMDKMRKYVPPLRPHKPSVPPAFKHVSSMPTSGIGAGSQPFNWNSNAIPPKPLQNTFRPDRPGQPGWGQGVQRSRSFNWKSNAIPPKHLQSTFRPDRPGQLGWGLEVSRSRPANPLRNMWQQGNRFSPLTPQPVQKRISAPPMRTIQSNPLRQMSQGLMNPNRARPMFR